MRFLLQKNMLISLRMLSFTHLQLAQPVTLGH